MKKISAVFCIIILSVFFAASAFAANENAYFMIDTNLATAGYQGIDDVMDIGAKAKVGFALYAMNWQNAKGFTVKFEWDGTKAEYRSGDSSAEIVDDDETINGAEITYAEENNILSGDIGSLPVESSDGLYSEAFFLKGAGNISGPEGLVFLAVFRTLDAFKTSDALTIKASLTVADENGNERFLGTRYFHVNMSVGVEEKTWGEVKSQYKDF
ncbi:MAG: hypothetical protein JXB48_06555 [Candidatus Latescibacteria bacterium]|nr:hypothetical protein [Candidatus Latescibacterota bacterium]